jgi:ankyrin repeat protein
MQILIISPPIKMGCCSSIRLLDGSTFTEDSIKKLIDRNNPKKFDTLDRLFKQNPNLIKVIDSPFTEYQGMEISPLGYALMRNKLHGFKKLLDLGASLDTLEDLLHHSSKTILEVVCFHGYGDFFKYFLPNIDQHFKYSVMNPSEMTMTLSIDFDASALYGSRSLRLTTMPIHLAIDQGHLQIIDMAAEHLKKVGRVPPIVDIHHIFERTGENCALVACRKGQFAIVKYLWENTQADFTIQNKNKENALILTAAGSKKNPNGDHLEIFIYLVEVVKLDYRESYEEVLLLLENKSILSYFSKLLKKTGIHKKKAEVEETFKPKPVYRPKPDPAVDRATFEVISRSEQNESVLSEINPEVRTSSLFSYFFSSFFSSETDPK